MAEPDELYVGYLPAAPPALARVVRRRVAALLLAAPVLAAVVVAAFHPFSAAVFEFGTQRTFTGVVRSSPYPTLVVPREGVPTSSASPASRYLLVAPGKLGAERLVAGWEGEWVRLAGTLVHRDGQTMVEVAPGSVEGVAAAGVAADGWTEDLGIRTYEGEIVDSKCFLGVMKPGSTKPHRACAARCIGGGVPPVLLVRDEEGRASYFLLASAAGEAVNDQVIDLVAEPVRITGRVLRYDDLLVLRADPSAYNRRD